MSPELSNYLKRIRVGVSQATDLSHLADWICQNTTDPRDVERNWSFDEHEYQIEILNDVAEDIVIRKCSQVGLSELSVRMCLAMCGMFKSITGIYVLPTSGFATKFAKQRVDPVIDNSKVLKAMISKDTDSSELKRFSNSFLYFAGSQKEGISVPANLLVIDELDFCSQRHLTTYSSRLRHARPGYRRNFSTPTVHNFGVDKLFQNSNQKYYTVKCRHCHDWVTPDPLTCLEIPGFEGTLAELDRSDLYSAKVKPDEAFLRCPNCRTPVHWQDLCDPSKRRWVAAKPDANRAGYQVYPFDVPTYNTLPKVIRQIEEYESVSDYYNFVWGLPHESADRTFMESAVRGNIRNCFIPPDEDALDIQKMYGTVMGVDVGKTSWIMIGKPSGKFGLQVIYMEHFRQTTEGSIKERVKTLAKHYGVVRGVIDAGPDFSTSQGVVWESNPMQFWACYYVNQSKAKIDNLTLKEDEGVVTANRTGTFDALSKAVNGGLIQFPQCDDTETMVKHLKALKRVETVDDEGERLARWVKVDDDHYAHALNYMNMAATMLSDRYFNAPVAAVPMMTKTRMKQYGDKDRSLN